jgi:GntR family transcriptional regulator, galactonate operon transcriptional repressor
MLKDSKTTVLSRLPGLEPTGGFAAKPGPRRLNETVAHQLAVLIIGGKLKPGETLPKEDAFAAALSVSRTAYREAVRMLTAKGLLTAKPRAGTRVLPREQWSLLDPDVLAWHLEVEPSRSFILSLFELREVVEPSAAALAAERRDADDLAAIATALRRLEDEPEGLGAVLDADLAFHHAILKATRSDALIAMSPAIGSTLRWSVALTIFALPRVYREALPFHQGIFAAIRARKAREAEGIMREHIQAATRNTLASLEAAGLATA